MADAVPTPGVRETYNGMTWGNLLDDTLDQAGADRGDYTDEELARFKRWMVETYQKVFAEVPNESGIRSGTLSVNITDVLYYLDYDVEQVLYASNAGEQVLVLTRSEYEDELHANDGSIPASSSMFIVLWELHGGTRRWIVRVVPAQTAASTIDLVYKPKAGVLSDLEHLIPLPALFHPPMRHAMRVLLHTRQEDWQAKEDAMRDFELSLVTARSRYKPHRSVRKAFRSSYQRVSRRSRAGGSRQ